MDVRSSAGFARNPEVSDERCPKRNANCKMTIVNWKTATRTICILQFAIRNLQYPAGSVEHAAQLTTQFCRNFGGHDGRPDWARAEQRESHARQQLGVDVPQTPAPGPYCRLP